VANLEESLDHDRGFRAFLVLNFVPGYGSFYGTKFHFFLDLSRVFIAWSWFPM